MPDVRETLSMMTQVAPPGEGTIADPELDHLRALTARLLAQRPDSDDELRRYLSIQERSIPVPTSAVRAAVGGRRVVVTGGSGCVGSELLRRLRDSGAAELVSVANTPPARSVSGVRYMHLDICDGERTRECLRALRPDLIFHLAAQREPGLAEEQVGMTVRTNVLGTHHVAEAAEQAGVAQLVYSSTGKALRPWTADVYAESKRMGEYLLSQVARRGRMACSGVRFTHVVDNSIVLDRFRRACHTGRPLRLHSTETVFYAQSAKESAELMLVALAESAARPQPVLRLFTIRDLGWPVSLLDLAVGILRESGGGSPLYIAGHDPGYERIAYPGLYDPARAGDLSPLINALEADEATECLSSAVDAFPVRVADGKAGGNLLSTLLSACEYGAEGAIREAFRPAAWALLEAVAQTASPTVLHRLARLTDPHRPTMPAEHRRMDDVFRRYAGVAAAASS
jgi:nucleoside-diphosphate-sugar epimerase